MSGRKTTIVTFGSDVPAQPQAFGLVHDGGGADLAHDGVAQRLGRGDGAVRIGDPLGLHHTDAEAAEQALGLPFVRTSVDHGTALDLAAEAGRARSADPGSLYAALDLALELAQRRNA